MSGNLASIPGGFSMPIVIPSTRMEDNQSFGSEIEYINRPERIIKESNDGNIIVIHVPAEDSMVSKPRPFLPNPNCGETWGKTEWEAVWAHNWELTTPGALSFTAFTVPRPSSPKVPVPVETPLASFSASSPLVGGVEQTGNPFTVAPVSPWQGWAWNLACGSIVPTSLDTIHHHVLGVQPNSGTSASEPSQYPQWQTTGQGNKTRQSGAVEAHGHLNGKRKDITVRINNKGAQDHLNGRRRFVRGFNQKFVSIADRRKPDSTGDQNRHRDLPRRYNVKRHRGPLWKSTGNRSNLAKYPRKDGDF